MQQFILKWQKTRECLKNAFCEMYVTKSSAKRGRQIAKSIFRLCVIIGGLLMLHSIELINKNNFAAFGSIIEFPEEDISNFYIVASDDEKPWRLAVFRYHNHEILTIECHPTSMESFEPVAGTTLLLVAEHDTPEEYHIFLLDKPVILKKGIWHQTLSLTDYAEVKITENIDVYSDFYELKHTLRCGVEEVG